ncbi:MAG: hypothetical protein M1819_000643 [Sarea resinae]|nr:MAG: hypothetical protein M1819_000643 [Sarea resinae]
MAVYGYFFLVCWLYRYVRLIINCVSHWTFRPIPLPDEPTLGSQDVTIIIPTIDGDNEELRATIRSCLRTEPFEIILVTTDAELKRADKMVQAMSTSRIRVLSIARANKRRQMCRAIPEVLTEITVFADDDVEWPPRILEWMLAPFEDPGYGGVGTCQRLKRVKCPDLSTRIWNFLGAIYLERRNFDISATSHIDGGIPCLSGRTVAYRTQILQDPAFTYGFTHEVWFNTYQLNADDDNFITRWIFMHQWKTYIQYCKEAELTTTLEDNSKFIKQCLRWSRSNWRSNLTSMIIDRSVWTKQPWSAYAVQITTITQWAFLSDVTMVWLLYKATEDSSQCLRNIAFVAMISWMVLSKFIKLIGHFIRYPEDVWLWPISPIFGYLHGLLKLYAAFTLHETAWGSRAGADTDDEYRMIPIESRMSAEMARSSMESNKPLMG